MKQSRVRTLSVPHQCEWPSDRMFNKGGCSYGTDEEKAAWRAQHMPIWKPGRDPGFCSRAAKMMIEGRRLCPLHAGQVALEIVRGMPAEEGEDEMKKTSITEALGLSKHLVDGGTLRNLREHAARLRDEIYETSREVGGDPWRSVRYREALRVVELVDGFSELAAGHYNPPMADEAAAASERLIEDPS